MTDRVLLKHKFVEFIPRDLEPNTIYVSIPYATAIHNCCCGCGNRVVTPLSPADWKLIFDGRAISLEPSIGNWSFSCKSHYWIKNNCAVWARTWSEDEISDGRKNDARSTAAFFGDHSEAKTEVRESNGHKKPRADLKKRIGKWFRGEQKKRKRRRPD